MTDPVEPPRRNRANWILAGLIGLFGVVVFAVAVRDGRADSALLFVALPVLLAATLALSPGRTAHGRVFVTTELGIQVFDPAGRLAGIISKPVADGKVVSCEFAGKNHDILYVAAGDRIFGRRLKVTGYFR